MIRGSPASLAFDLDLTIPHHYHHQWRYSPESGLGLPYGFRNRKITMWVISSTINLILVILIPETSSGEATTDI
jgi:hypothetical protein